ncbi:hypothetical protein ACO0SA_001121 [Hanseniaspora valbyensis]
MPTRLLKNTDIIYDPETKESLVEVLYNKNGDFVGINYEKFFDKIKFHVDKEINTNPEFHQYLNKEFVKNGLTDQKDFKKTVCAFKKVIEGCYLECKSRDDIYDNCKFRVSIRKCKDDNNWKVSSNTANLNFTCTCGISPELTSFEDDFKQQVDVNLDKTGEDKENGDENGKNLFGLPPKKPVNYYQCLKKFSIEKPGTLSFGVLRQFISAELPKQMNVSKSFKVQVRRTGGSKLSDYAFVECFSSDNKNKNCKFKVSIKRNKSTNIWTLDETSTRKIYDCICENNTDINDENGDVIKDGAPRLAIDVLKKIQSKNTSKTAKPKTSKKNKKTDAKEQKEEIKQDKETVSEDKKDGTSENNYFENADAASANKENDNNIEVTTTEKLTSEIGVKHENGKKLEKSLNSNINENSVQHLLEAAIEVVQNKEVEQQKPQQDDSQLDNVFDEKNLKELENSEVPNDQLSNDSTSSNKKKRKSTDISDMSDENIKKQKLDKEKNEEGTDYYKLLHDIVFDTQAAINKNELCDILHAELIKHGIKRKFECNLKSRSKEFTNGLYVSCPNQCGFKAVFRRTKDGPWSLYSKSKVGVYKCNCFSPSGEILEKKDVKVPVIGEEGGIIEVNNTKDNTSIPKQDGLEKEQNTTEILVNKTSNGKS